MIMLWDANMIRTGGVALTAASDVSSVLLVFARICVSGLCRHLLCSGAHRHFPVHWYGSSASSFPCWEASRVPRQVGCHLTWLATCTVESGKV